MVLKMVGSKNKIETAFAAFTLSNGVIINFFNYNGMESVGGKISVWCLYLMTIISLLSVLKNRAYQKPMIIMAGVFIVLVIYERLVDLFGTVHEFEGPFLIHGLGGFVIGLTLCNINLFTKYIAILSAFYSLILITEPINHAVLHMDEMLTGYLMTGLTINLILAYFTIFKNNKIILAEAVISSVIIALFTARGCGLALLSAWGMLYFWSKKSEGRPVGKTVFRLSVLSVIAYIIITSIIERVLGLGLELESGSLLEKMSNGYVDSVNGRDDVWEIGLGLLARSPLTGIGFGADRTVATVFFVHNIILELCINFGIPIAFLILISYWKTTFKGIKKSSYTILSFLIIAQILKTWIQLLFSSSYLYTMLPLMFIIGLSVHAIVKKKNIQYE